jgi:fumarate reductase subunit D
MDIQNPQQPPQFSPPQGPVQKSQISAMALISYLGILCLIPILTKDQDEFVKFHSRQGLVILIGEVAVLIVMFLIPPLWGLLGLVNLFWLVLSIVGIMNVINNKKEQIPLVGKFADRIKI